jgi:hypothetical protein
VDLRGRPPSERVRLSAVRARDCVRAVLAAVPAIGKPYHAFRVSCFAKIAWQVRPSGTRAQGDNPQHLAVWLSRRTTHLTPGMPARVNAADTAISSRGHRFRRAEGRPRSSASPQQAEGLARPIIRSHNRIPPPNDRTTGRLSGRTEDAVGGHWCRARAVARRADRRRLRFRKSRLGCVIGPPSTGYAASGYAQQRSGGLPELTRHVGGFLVAT